MEATLDRSLGGVGGGFSRQDVSSVFSPRTVSKGFGTPEGFNTFNEAGFKRADEGDTFSRSSNISIFAFMLYMRRMKYMFDSRACTACTRCIVDWDVNGVYKSKCAVTSSFV